MATLFVPRARLRNALRFCLADTKVAPWESRVVIIERAMFLRRRGSRPRRDRRDRGPHVQPLPGPGRALPAAGLLRAHPGHTARAGAPEPWIRYVHVLLRLGFSVLGPVPRKFAIGVLGLCYSERTDVRVPMVKVPLSLPLVFQLKSIPLDSSTHNMPFCVLSRPHDVGSKATIRFPLVYIDLSFIASI